MLRSSLFSRNLRLNKLNFRTINGNLSTRSYSKISLPSYLLNVPPTQISTLPSKLRVATEETFGETATIGVFIDSGSVYENEKNNGVAHFLEHMSFKGTQKRSRIQLEEEIENMGGVLNAYTSREQTVYYAKVLKKDIPHAVDFLSDILLNSKFENSAIESERQTILREMEEVNKDEHELIFDLLHSAAFQGTPLGRTILGPEENIRSIQRNDLVDFVQSNYHAPRIVVVGAGAIKHDELVNLAQKSFGSLPSSSIAQRSPMPFTGSLVTLRDDTVPEVHLAVAAQSVGWSHPDYFTFMIIQAIIGSWDRNLGGGKNLSSRLCELIATEKLCNSFTSFNTSYHNTGLFGFYISVEPESIENVVVESLSEWGRIAYAVTNSEIDRAKTKVKSSILMQLDGSTSVAEDIGRQLLAHGRRLTPAEIFLRIDSIKREDVLRVAQEHLFDVDIAVAGYGPTILCPDYVHFREWTSQKRW